MSAMTRGTGGERMIEELEALREENIRLRDGWLAEKRHACDLKKVIDAGRAAHNEERAARDWLAREKERLEVRVADLESLRQVILYGKTEEDNQHPLGEAWSMVHRFYSAAIQAAPRPTPPPPEDP